MSGGHWQYAGAPIRDWLEQIAQDEDVKQRWPQVAELFAALGPIIYEAEHDMDWDLSSDHAIVDDSAFDEQVCHSILVAAMKVAHDRLFPRGKWATIQAVQERADA